MCPSAVIGHRLPRLQLPDADVPPADLIRPLALADAVDLEPDEAPPVHLVGEVAGGYPVDPGAVAVALHDDPVAVPALVLEGLLCLRLDLGQPAAPAALVVEPARRPGLFPGDLALRAVDDPGPLAVLRTGVVLRVDVAADLDARI